MPEIATFSRDYFISRASADQWVGLAIAAIIREAGYSTWLQDEDFGHASFMARMEQGLESGGRVIALLSAAYQRSAHCRKEYNVVLSDDPLNIEERLIVLRVEDCAPTGHLRDISYTDLVPILAIGNAAERERLLKRAIRVLIGAEVSQSSVDFVNLCRRAPQQILHAEIHAVPCFTGREAELEALKAALWSEGGTAALTNSKQASAALRGLGGVGKSALAREYAWRERASYRGVWWVRAEKRETLLDDLIQLGARFIPGLEVVPDREQAARAVLDSIDLLRFEKPWLLVYDGAESPADIEILTPRAGAHVLITSRWQDWYGHASELAVDVFSEETAVSFMMARARGSAEWPEETRRAAVGLAEDLGRLPLALAIARAHAWGMNWTFKQYRGHLAQMLDGEPTKAVDYPRSINATFTLAIEKAQGTSSQAGQLLSIAAFLGPDRIPLGIITTDVMSEIEKGEAVATFAEVSLVDRETLDDGSSGISLHRLVQEVERWRLGEDAATSAALATRLVAEAYPNDPADVRNWSACRRLESHALAVLSVAPDAGEIAAYTTCLINKYALHLSARAEFAQAEPLYRRALKLGETSAESEDADVARDLESLAQLLMDTERLAKAEPLMRRIIASVERSLGSDQASIVTNPNNQALPQINQTQFIEAESLIRRALKIDERNFGLNHPSVARDLINLAQLLIDTSQFIEAESLIRRALDIDEGCFGPDHSNVARDLHNLAQLLMNTNRFAEAEPLIRRALVIDEKQLGLGHSDLGKVLNNLAQLLIDTNRHAEAEPLVRRALALNEKQLGPDHPHVIGAVDSLAQLLKSMNRLSEAEPLMRRVIASVERLLSPDHPYLTTNLDSLAQLLQQTGRLAEAELLMRRALTISENSSGRCHQSVGTRLSNLAALYYSMRRFVEAEPLMRRALAISEKSMGGDHPQVGRDINNLAQLLKETNRPPEALLLMRRALSICENRLGAGHPNTQIARTNYEALLSQLNESGARPAVLEVGWAPKRSMLSRLFGWRRRSARCERREE